MQRFPRDWLVGAGIEVKETAQRRVREIDCTTIMSDSPNSNVQISGLAAPLQRQDGTLVERDKGTPQGSAVSPVLANLFMHYGFDLWMRRTFPSVPFERYADDCVVHCVSQKQAEYVQAKIARRMQEVGLRLHPEKTRIVYCKDGQRREPHEHTSFTFLGFSVPRTRKEAGMSR